jgi:hypothetical protein
MHKKISYDRDATNGLYLLIDKILPIQGPFPIINFDEWSDAIQGGVRIGYSIKN